MSDVPYENATSGAAARDEIVRVLRRIGCERVGFMDDFDQSELLLHFQHRGRAIELRASAKGWAALEFREAVAYGVLASVDLQAAALFCSGAGAPFFC